MHANPPTSPAQLALSGPDPARVRLALTTRFGGVSQGRFASLNLGLHVGDEDDAVLVNRLRAATEFGVGLDHFVFAEQVAGTRVATVTSADRGRGARTRADAIPAADALVTVDSDVTLAMLAADCLLIALVDDTARVLATVHAGWQGATNGIIARTITAMAALGADPSRITATLGPAVAADRYQVGEEVADAALAALGSRVTDALRADGTGRYLFDIPAAARIQLVRSGVPEQQVHPFGGSTGPDTPFYSHRLEGPTGRFGLFAQLLPEVVA